MRAQGLTSFLSQTVGALSTPSLTGGWGPPLLYLLSWAFFYLAMPDREDRAAGAAGNWRPREGRPAGGGSPPAHVALAGAHEATGPAPQRRRHEPGTAAGELRGEPA